VVTKLPVQWYPRIFKSILNSSLTYQASFSPVLFLLQVQEVDRVSCDICPEELICLRFKERTFSNLSLGIVQQFHSGARHFRRGKDREKASRREDRVKERVRE